MEDVGGDHDVEPLTVEALGGEVALDVERAVVDERVGGELLAGPTEEVRRDVGVRVRDAPGRQAGQDVGRGAARAGADLEDAHVAHRTAGRRPTPPTASAASEL